MCAGTGTKAIEAWGILHESLRHVALELASVRPGRFALAMEPTGGVSVHDGDRFAGGCYYYGPTSGWIVIAPSRPTMQRTSLAGCLEALQDPPSGET